VAITEFPPLITREGDSVLVAAAGTQITLPARAESAVRQLLGGHPVRIADVAAIAHVLLEEGLCAEITDALRWACTGLLPTEPD